MIFIYLGSIYVLNNGNGWDWLAMTITGPNDARCVVWAKGIFFHSCFLLLTNFIIGSTYQVTTDKGGDEGIRPKWRKTRRLGQRCVFFSFFRVFYNLITFFLIQSTPHPLQYHHHPSLTQNTSRRGVLPFLCPSLTQNVRWRGILQLLLHPPPPSPSLHYNHQKRAWTMCHLSPWYVFYVFCDYLLLIHVLFIF